MEDSALVADDEHVVYDAASNYAYEEKTFEGSDFDRNSDEYRGNLENAVDFIWLRNMRFVIPFNEILV